MRGVLLVALGGALIWLGIITSGSDEGDSRGAGGSGDDLVTRLELPEGELPAPDPDPAQASKATSREDLAEQGDGSEADGPAGTDPPIQAEPAPAQPEPLPDPPVVREDPVEEPIEQPAADPQPAPLPRPGDGDGGRVFELGAPGGQPDVVGATLLESWVARDPSALESLLNGDSGAEIPSGQRRLIQTFWQAMLGQGAEVAGRLEELSGASGVTTAQLALLRTAIEGPGVRPLPASASRRDPIARAMRMVLLEEQSFATLERGAPADAAQTLSTLIHLELTAPWHPHRATLLAWGDSLREAQRKHRLSRSGSWPSLTTEVRNGDSLALVRQRVLREQPDLLLCTGLLHRVNEVRKYIHPGDQLRVPTDTPNVLVDLDARLVVYRHGDEAVLAWPCGIGRPGHDTPTGAFVIGEKLEEPPWFPGDGEQIPYGDPRNLLGERWMAWNLEGRNTSFGFHGTNDPDGVGERVSSGCIRMTNEDVVELFDLLPRGAQVLVQP